MYRHLVLGWTLTLIGVLLATGCATIGREFPVTAVTQIKIGETTQADIEALFGPPWRTGIDDGLVTWTYARYRYKLFGRVKTEDLVLRFDSRGIVASYTFNTTEHEEGVTPGSP